MSAIKDSGPAFPIVAEDNIDTVFERGMTLRDYFAAKAMQGELASQDPSEFYDDSEKDARGLAEWAYAMADAMLAAREAQSGKLVVRTVADARRDAAALELYEALRAFVCAVEDDGEPLPGTRWHREWTAARAALAKAVQP